MQSVSSRIWTRIGVFISYGDNDNTTGTSCYLRSKVLEYHAWPVDMVEFGAGSYALKKQVDVKQLYNQMPLTAWVSQFEFESVRVPVLVAVGVSWGRDADWESAADGGLWALSDPRLSSPARMRKKGCYGQKNFVAVSLRLRLTSHTQPTPTLSNKVWEVYFL